MNNKIKSFYLHLPTAVTIFGRPIQSEKDGVPCWELLDAVLLVLSHAVL